MKSSSWKTLSSTVVHRNPWYYVRKDKVIQPNGKPGTYFVTVRPPAVFIVAVDDQQAIQLIGLDRYATDTYSIEIPAGGVEEGETPLAAAKRELREETGLKASRWKRLGTIQLANGFLNQPGYVFLAQGLSSVSDHEQEEEGIREVLRVSLDQAFTLMEKGKIVDCQTIAALGMVSRVLG